MGDKAKGDDRDVFDTALDAATVGSIPAGAIMGALIARGLSRKAARRFIERLKTDYPAQKKFYSTSAGQADAADYVRSEGRYGAVHGARDGAILGGVGAVGSGVLHDSRRKKK